MVGESNCSSVASNQEQLQDFIHDLMDPGVGTVHLVDHHDDLVSQPRAFWRTNRVWGRPLRRPPAEGTPLTIFRIRSTSPPKSAWPGVSTILILVFL